MPGQASLSNNSKSTVTPPAWAAEESEAGLLACFQRSLAIVPLAKRVIESRFARISGSLPRKMNVPIR